MMLQSDVSTCTKRHKNYRTNVDITLLSLAWSVKPSSLVNVSQFNYRQHLRKTSLKYISYGTQWYHLTIIPCDLLTLLYYSNPLSDKWKRIISGHEPYTIIARTPIHTISNTEAKRVHMCSMPQEICEAAVLKRSH